MNKKILNELKNDKNISFLISLNNKKPCVSIESYNIDLLKNKEYVKNTFEKIVLVKNDICTELNADIFNISISNYTIDGLYESNSMLITKESQITCIY